MPVFLALGKRRTISQQMKAHIPYIMAVALALCTITGCNRNPLAAKSEQPDTLKILVAQARKCSRLYTAEYKVHKIITHTDNVKLEGNLFQRAFSLKLPLGERKIAIPIDATLKAYIDMSALSASDISRDGNKITVRLPDPQVVITSASIDHDAVKQHVSLLRRGFSDEELSAYEKLGRQTIASSVGQMDIKEMARHGATRVLVPMIEQLGFAESDINIVFADSDGSGIIHDGNIEKRRR